MFVRDLAMTVQAAFARTVPKITYCTLCTYILGYPHTLMHIITFIASSPHWLTFFVQAFNVLCKILKHKWENRGISLMFVRVTSYLQVLIIAKH